MYIELQGSVFTCVMILRSVNGRFKSKSNLVFPTERIRVGWRDEYWFISERILFIFQSLSEYWSVLNHWHSRYNLYFSHVYASITNQGFLKSLVRVSNCRFASLSLLKSIKQCLSATWDQVQRKSWISLQHGTIKINYHHDDLQENLQKWEKLDIEWNEIFME